MKKITIALTLLTSAVAMSATTALQKDDNGIYPVRVNLKKVYLSAPECPPNAMCAPMVYADVSVRLAGCFDRLGPISSNVEVSHDGKQARLTVSAVAIRNKKSAITKCIAAPVKMEKILITGGSFAMPDVELLDLNGTSY